MRVVIVEDEAVVALELQACLEDLGHEVCAMAASVDAALAVIERHKPDIITVDIRLAGSGSGIDVAQIAYERWGVRSLVISGNIDADVAQRIESLRPLGCLNKPYALSEVRCILGKAA